MFVTGAPNYPKPNVIPLSGVVETHWLSYTFTMNWRFTQPGSFTMDIGEPYCQIFPVNMDTFDNIVPEIRTLSEDEEFYDLYWDWNISRANYATERKIPDSSVSNPEIWQKHYFQGKYPPGKIHPEGAKCPFHTNNFGITESVHKTKPNVPEFVDLQSGPFKTVSDYQERTKQSRILYEEHIKKQRELEIQNAKSLGAISKIPEIINRTPEEIEERIAYYKEILKQQIHTNQENGICKLL
jgi:hypothetical protein